MNVERVDWDHEKVVEGIYVLLQDLQSASGDFTVVNLYNPNGVVYSFSLSAGLRGIKDNAKYGDYLEITPQGWTKTKNGRLMRQFSIARHLSKGASPEEVASLQAEIESAKYSNFTDVP